MMTRSVCSSQQGSFCMLFSKLRIPRPSRSGPLDALTIAITTIKAYNQKMPRNAPVYTNLIILEAIFNLPLCMRLKAANTLHCAARIGFPNRMATSN